MTEKVMSQPIVILLDTSTSMAEPIGSRRRIDVLADILCQALPSTPGVRLFGFSSAVTELEGATSEHGVHLPEPAGGTALHFAIRHVAPLRPSRLIVISDGEPDDADAALSAARELDCEIITYFAGDERHHAAVGFLRALAWCSADGLGRAAVTDLRDPRRLAGELQLLLTGPVA
jgi:hypothetical protein